jgi:alkylhydroperoxidase family enzyme
MTWLPVDGDGHSERDAVLGLKSEVYEILRGTLTTVWRITDPHLLDLCRLRVAQMAGARAELASADERLLMELDAWSSSSAFSERERAAIGYAEQYHVDHRAITSTQTEDLARHLPRHDVVNFVWALHLNDAYARILSLLDIEPDPPTAPVRLERVPPRDAVAAHTTEIDVPARNTASKGVDPAFSEAYGVLGRAVVRQTLVDEVTSEAVRLHNASHQGCQY